MFLQHKLQYMKRCLCLLLSVVLMVNLYSQQNDSTLLSAQSISTGTDAKKSGNEPVYKIRPWVDIPVALAFDAYSFYGMSVIYGRDAIPESEILGLDKKNVNSFDRTITDNYSLSAKKASDYFFYGSMPLPLFLLLDKNIRRDGLKVGLMFLEAMGTTGVIYTSAAMIANRYRPYAYNPKVPMETRRRGGARNSFFAGHPSVVGTSTFFMAKVYCDYHPEMKHKWILYTLAGGITATTGLLRLQAGQHFRTDVLTGLVIGPIVGILVPQIHKNKKFGKSRITLMPNFQEGSTGFTALYKLGK